MASGELPAGERCVEGEEEEDCIDGLATGCCCFDDEDADDDIGA